MQPASLTGSVVSAVDRLLHISAGLFQDFTHLAGHVCSESVLIADQYLAQAKENFGAFGSGRVAPSVKCSARSIHCRVHVITRGKREATNNVLSVCRVNIFKHFAGLTLYPLTANVVLVG